MFLLCMKIVLAFVLALLPLAAQVVTTEPVGFNKVTCLANSDTIVGVPLRVQGSITTKLAAVPTLNGELATLSLASSALPAFSKHYLKFIGGTRDGRWYDITANTATSVTIDLNGDNLNGVISGDSVLIAEYWTLNSLFPPAGATTSWTETPVGSGNWVPNGHAIFASTSTFPAGRRTELRFRDLVYAGINPPYSAKYYIHGGIWKLSGGGNTDRGSVALAPDTFLTISHPSTVTRSTTFRALGEVEFGSMNVPLFTLTSGSRDNLISILRPVNVSLESLNLRQSGAFVPSTSTFPSGRLDELLIFDNLVQLQNKTPSMKYYVHNGIWKLSGGGNTNRGLETVPAGSAFIVRKFKSDDGHTDMWLNTYPF